MCSFDTVLVILRKKNITQRMLANHLGIKETAVSEWKAGRNDAWRKYLPQIAEFLGVTVDELLGDRPLISYYPFTLPQKKVIELLTRLDDDDLMRLEGMIQMLLADDKYKKISALQDA